MLPGGLLVLGVFTIAVPEVAKEIQNTLRKVNYAEDIANAHSYILLNSSFYLQTCLLNIDHPSVLCKYLRKLVTV